jgi:hypothetical protein
MKFIVVLIVLFLSINKSQAQKIGFETTYNFAKLSTQSFDRGISAFQIGIIGNLMKNGKLFHINTGLKFNQKGFKRKVFDGDRTTRLNYLEFPLNFAIHFYYNEDKSSMYFQAGPYMAFALSDGYPMDFGINTGVGVDLAHFKVGIGYSIGMVEVKYKNFNRVYFVSFSFFI